MALGPVATAVAATHAVQAVGALAYIAVPTLAPAIARDVGVDPVHVGVYVSLMWGAAVWSSAMTGRLLARFGAFAVSRLTAAVCGLGALIATFGDLWALVVAAIMIGLGCGPETPASSAILGRIVPPARQPFLLSLKQTGVQAGAVLAGLMLPALEAASGWRVALGVVCVINVGAAFAFRPLDRLLDGPRREGVQGGGGLREGLRLVFASRPILVLSVAAFFFSMLQICMNGYLVTFGVVDLGYDLAKAGLLLAAAQSGGFVGRPFWGYVAGRYVAARTLIGAVGIGMALAGMTMGILGGVLGFGAVAAVAFLFGMTTAGWNGVYIAEIARLAPAGRIGQVSGAAFTFGFTGLVVGPLAYGAIAAQASYGAGYVTLAVVCIGAGVLLLARRA
jgi:MFS family permease